MIRKDSVAMSDFIGSLVDRVYKILPLYEEENEGLYYYIQSLIYELEGLLYLVEDLDGCSNYVSLMATLESLSNDCIVPLGKEGEVHSVIKREVFKCIDITKNLKDELGGDAND